MAATLLISAALLAWKQSALWPSDPEASQNDAPPQGLAVSGPQAPPDNRKADDRRPPLPLPPQSGDDDAPVTRRDLTLRLHGLIRAQNARTESRLSRIERRLSELEGTKANQTGVTALRNEFDLVLRHRRAEFNALRYEVGNSTAEVTAKLDNHSVAIDSLNTLNSLHSFHDNINVLKEKVHGLEKDSSKPRFAENLFLPMA